MQVIAKWTDPDGTLMAQTFRSWADFNNWLPPVGMSDFSVEEVRPGTDPDERRQDHD